MSPVHSFFAHASQRALPPVSAPHRRKIALPSSRTPFTVPSIPWKLQAITAPGHALESAVTAFPGVTSKPDALAGLAEAQVGTLELAALVGDAQPVVFVQ